MDRSWTIYKYIETIIREIYGRLQSQSRFQDSSINILWLNLLIQTKDYYGKEVQTEFIKMKKIRVVFQISK